MLSKPKCTGAGSVSFDDGTTGEEALRPFFVWHDFVYLEDEMEPPVREFDDLLSSEFAGLERAQERVQCAEAVRVEKLDAARRAFRGERDVVLVHGHQHPLSEEEALRRAFTAEVATRLRVSERAAVGMIHEAQTLVEDLPEVMDALRVGWITYQHARIAARQAWSVPKEHRAAFDAEVVGKARTQTPSRFSSTARKLRERLHPDTIEARKKDALAFRKVEFLPEQDGMAWVGVYHSADVAQSIHEQARTIARRRKNATPDETRTLAQVEADAFAEALLTAFGQETLRIGASTNDTAGRRDGKSDGAARGSARRAPSGDVVQAGDSGGSDDVDDSVTVHCDSRIDASDVGAADDGDPSRAGSGAAAGGDTDPMASTRNIDSGLAAAQLAALRPNVTITVPALTLLGHSDEPAVLNGYGPIDYDTAAKLIGQTSSFTRITTHPVDGTVVSIDPAKYRLSEEMKRLIRTRDGTCGFPGCDQPAERCDIDHIVAWKDGGRSVPENLVSLCRSHHTLKHTTRWRSEVSPDGSLVWTSPTGAVHTTRPGDR